MCVHPLVWEPTGVGSIGIATSRPKLRVFGMGAWELGFWSIRKWYMRTCVYTNASGCMNIHIYTIYIYMSLYIHICRTCVYTDASGFMYINIMYYTYIYYIVYIYICNCGVWRVGWNVSGTQKVTKAIWRGTSSNLGPKVGVWRGTSSKFTPCGYQHWRFGIRHPQLVFFWDNTKMTVWHGTSLNFVTFGCQDWRFAMGRPQDMMFGNVERGGLA